MRHTFPFGDLLHFVMTFFSLSRVPGKSTFAVQADFQPGRQISWWIWWCGPIPVSKHMGEPLVRTTTLLLSDLLLPFRFRSKLSLVVEARWPLYTWAVSNSGLVIQTWDQLWEAASTLCLPSQPSRPYSIICVPVFLFFFLPTISPMQTVKNFDSMQWLMGETSWAFLKTECVHLSDLHTVQQSSQMSPCHVNCM